MILGSIYVIWFAADFLGPFQGFLITLGVPLAAWCGIFLADLLLRSGSTTPRRCSTPRGRYGATNVPALGLLLVGTLLGWGLVTNTYASWLSWQGYLLGPFGLGGKDGDWAYANVGVVVALAVGFVGYLALCGRTVRARSRGDRADSASPASTGRLGGRVARLLAARAASSGCWRATPPGRRSSTAPPWRGWPTTTGPRVEAPGAGLDVVFMVSAAESATRRRGAPGVRRRGRRGRRPAPGLPVALRRRARRDLHPRPRPLPHRGAHPGLRDGVDVPARQPLPLDFLP